ncbi:MAG: DNA recombination protein RmuC [Proteobacteria bacterium]|nr:DNA recombination protein RmuC [Pseudomonadota bacterium]
MTTTLLVSILICAAAGAAAGFILFFTRSNKELSKIQTLLEGFEKNQQRIEAALKAEMAQGRSEAGHTAQLARQELTAGFKTLGDSLLSRMTDIATLQKQQLDTFSNQLTALTRVNEEKLEAVRLTVEQRLQLLQEDNSRKLESMRQTVDEKLHATLEQRLGESFKLVGERLEQVHRGLGEMQSLAAGVGDLKKVLTNVKTRGTWGEMSLGFLLEELFTRDQYAANVATKKGSADRVEFAIRLPGREQNDSEVWLPIDAKFPDADYQKLLEAQEKADPALVEEASKNLERFIKNEAKKIQEKYIDPPHTTDFAVMYLPVESLYAEVLRRPGLAEALQHDHRIVVTGPTTLAALLNSLQMGFRTLTIEKRSSEVWSLLGTVKKEFGNFGDLLDKTHKKLQEASNTIEDASRKSRTIERKLKGVQELPVGAPLRLIADLDDDKEV